MPSYNASTLVLHRTDLGEHDRILTLFARELGKLSAIAKGARKSGSRLSGGTELFTQSRLQLATGRSLDIVTQCEIEQSFSGLRMDLQRLARATYFCELLDRFTGDRDQASSQELFDLTMGALHLLQRAEQYLDGVVHAYELQLLSTVGYAPVLDRCVVCGQSQARAAAFSPSMGGVVCLTDRGRAGDSVMVSQEALSVLVRLQTGESSVVLDLSPAPKAAAEVARALRWFVRFRAERSLKSADFLDQLRTAG